MRHLRTLWIGAVLALMAAAPARGDEEARLTVLHTTDLHGALTGWDYTAGRSTPRGLVRIASMVRAARAEGRPTLLVDAGDALQGGIESALGAGAS
jgi:2',3'-cyclic-nucleotide 2'-phosphodiesterase/3'-nucleotidase